MDGIKYRDFLPGWDERNGHPGEYMLRPEPVVYWCCPTCRRAYEFQVHAGGTVAADFHQSGAHVSFDPECVKNCARIYVMPDTEIVAVINGDDDDHRTRLTDYIAKHNSVCHCISPDESQIYALDKASGRFLYTYVPEDKRPG